MLPLHAFLLYCGLYAIAIAVPGPGIVSLVARALGSGFKSTLPAVAGTAIGDWALMTLSAFGLAFVARELGTLFLVIKLAGASYLVYLGYRYWTTPVSDLAPKPGAANGGFLAQLALTLGNPKAIAFFVALLPTVVDLRHLNAVGYGELSAATFVLIPAIALTYTALASRVRGFLQSKRARQRINKGAAVIMVGAGVGVAVT
jgi:threonine/homoserine/homoserine lactone efflux protein